MMLSLQSPKREEEKRKRVSVMRILAHWPPFPSIHPSISSVDRKQSETMKRNREKTTLNARNDVESKNSKKMVGPDESRFR
jgi:hypothetical protein